MKSKIIKSVALVMIIAISVPLYSKASAHRLEVNGDPFKEPVKMRCTCYIDRGTTASGAQTRDGIIAGRREWLGYVACIYAIKEDGSIGDFIGYYEFKDTGAGIDTDGDGRGDSIKNGLSVDVWRSSMSEARNWVKTYGDYVYIKIIKGVG